MTGTQLKAILVTSGYPQAILAEKLGITPSAFSSYLRAQDVRSGLLESIAMIIGKDMSFFYPECKSRNEINIDNSEVTTYGENSPGIVGGDYHSDQAVKIAVLEERIKQKDEQITLLKSLLK